MSVHLKVENEIISYANVAGWETLQLSFSQRWGLNLNLEGKKSFFSSPNFIRIGEFNDKNEADNALMEIMEKIIEVERNGGGMVTVM